jgi:hypothetical protein
VTEETIMAMSTRRQPLPLTRDLALAFRLTNATATLLVGASIAGLLYGPRGWWYDANPATLPAFIGQDVMTLIVGAPLLVGSAFLTRRGSLRALLCWMGAFFYIAYSYYFYVIGGRFNALFPFYIAIVSMAVYGTLAVFSAIDLRLLPERFVRPPLALISAFFVVTALSFAGLWLSVIDRHLVAGTQIDPVSRVVIAIDGVVLLPLLFYGGRALARREPIGYALAALLLVKATATFLTLIVNTAIARRWGHSPDGLQTFAYGVGFVGALTLLVWFLECVNTDGTPSRHQLNGGNEEISHAC